MTPKQKAEELVNKFKSNVYKKAFADTDLMYDRYYGLDDEMAKQCALIAVDELIYFSSNQSLSVDFDSNYYCDYDFFIEVKKEIEAL